MHVVQDKRSNDSLEMLVTESHCAATNAWHSLQSCIGYSYTCIHAFVIPPEILRLSSIRFPPRGQSSMSTSLAANVSYMMHVPFLSDLLLTTWSSLLHSMVVGDVRKPFLCLFVMIWWVIWRAKRAHTDRHECEEWRREWARHERSDLSNDLWVTWYAVVPHHLLQYISISPFIC
jgi:hypothetical protein